MFLRVLFKLWDVFFTMLLSGEKFATMKMEYCLEHARHFGGVGDIDRAIEWLNKALTIDSDDFSVYAGFALAYSQKRNFSHALYYAKAAAINLKRSGDALNKKHLKRFLPLSLRWKATTRKPKQQ